MANRRRSRKLTIHYNYLTNRGLRLDERRIKFGCRRLQRNDANPEGFAEKIRAEA